jgi:hypothetical protein
VETQVCHKRTAFANSREKCGLTTLLLALTVVPLTAPNLTEQQCMSSVNTAINSLVPTLGTPTQPILFGGNLVGAYNTRIANEDLSVVLDWVDGLTAAGVQRIEFNP